MLRFDDVLAAKERLRGAAHRTPVMTSRQFNEAAGCEVYFKCENLQRAGAFKFRGAYNALASLDEETRKRGVIAYSSGNHAQAVALAAKMFGAPAVLVMPQDAPKAKAAATRDYGAEIVFYDRYTENRAGIGARIAAERGLTMIPPYDDYRVMAGQATAAVELIEDVPELDDLLVPTSGSGLLAGSAVAVRTLRPGARVYGVEPEEGNDTLLSLRRGERITIEVPRTIADGLQVTTPGELTFPIVRELVEDILLVSDREIIDAMRFMLERMKIVVEPSGAVGAAAVRSRKTDFAGRRVGVILSGGNVDMEKLSAYLKSD
ncbi:MAG: threo-3-hydroxy-L-aspartate ammonia-lyase [Blastocatellales bacterium]|nr:threo-3-hydroxy-L-aspartate ammonia-lyase [Blastocatellales bacterium]